MKITILVGLPCSGKSTYGNKLDGVFIDDISIENRISLLFDYTKLLIPNIIISDVTLCNSCVRSSCITFLNNNFPNYEQEWIYFTNSPEDCLKNEIVRKSNGDLRNVSGLIKLLTKEYVIPIGAKIIDCYR